MSSLKLMQPQEIEVFYILPAIRHEIAKVLKDLKVPQKEIANLLVVKESTVSQYINNKRANVIEFNDTIKKYIKECTLKIKSGENMVMHTHNILKLIRKENVLCDIHKKYAHIPVNCSMDKMGCC